MGYVSQYHCNIQYNEQFKNMKLHITNSCLVCRMLAFKDTQNIVIIFHSKLYFSLTRSMSAHKNSYKFFHTH